MEDFKLEEMCQKLVAHEYAPQKVLCWSLEKSSGIWFVLNGVLNVYESKGSKPILLNSIEVGMSCGDPEMNYNVSLTS